MRSSRFSGEQIISILAEQERGVPTGDVCRKHGVSSATFYKWKAKNGGLEGEACAAIGSRPCRTMRVG